MSARKRFTERKVIALLRKRGYRLTPQRRAIIRAIALSRDCLTPADIYKRVLLEHPGIGLVTVYRTLEMLEGLGLTCEIHAGGSCRSYLMRRPQGHHHHLICSECGVVLDSVYCDLGALEQKISNETGFQIKDHLLEFSGSCSKCQKKA